MHRMNLSLRGFTVADQQLAASHPVQYAVRAGYRFASSLAFVALVAELIAPSVVPSNEPGHVLFIAVFTGVGSGLLQTMILRRTLRNSSPP